MLDEGACMLSISTEKNKIIELSNTSLSSFVEQYIWGHRIHDEQTPEMIFLEFLCILLDNKDSPLSTKTGGLGYVSSKRLRMRELIFKNPYLDLIDSDNTLDNDGKWAYWSEKFCNNAKYFDPCHSGKILEQLKSNFEKIDGNTSSFKTFANLIYLLRTISFETGSSKRWTSNYVFPVGPNAVYADCNLEGEGDRRFFARTGELLYLMLSRSDKSEELGEKLTQAFLSDNNPLNKGLDLLQVTNDGGVMTLSDAMYLPDERCELFNQLADDWLAILNLKMPINDHIFFLCQLSALYFIEYILFKTKVVLGEQTDTNIVCEVVSTQNTKVRKLSADRFIQNNSLSSKALEKFIDTIQDDDVWKENLINYPDIASHNIELICKYFHLSNKTKKEYEEKTNLDDALNLLKENSTKLHKTHLGLVHSVYAKSIGLASNIRTNRTRYILSDQLLKTLIYANVKKRMVLHEFLDVLHKKYNIIIGQNEAQQYIDNKLCDADDFRYNLRVLEKRLDALGLLFRLSDSYAYVQNPFS